MDEKDILFLAKLRQNSRESLTDISRATGIPISTLYDRLKSHEKSIITKHAAILDFAKLGYTCRANIAIKVDIEQREEVKKYLLSKNCVNSLFKINNGFDFLIEGIFKHVKEMEDFMELFEKRFPIKDKDTHYIIEDLKREEFLAEII